MEILSLTVYIFVFPDLGETDLWPVIESKEGKRYLAIAKNHDLNFG